MKKGKKKNKRKISFFKILALILFVASLFISYILYKVNILPDKYLYIVYGTLAFINIVFSCINSIPYCITSSIIITKLNEIKFKLFLFPLIQSILVLDYYLPLKICVMIKCIIRFVGIWIEF